MRWETMVVAATIPGLVTQYILIYLAATSGHTRMTQCIPQEFGGYKEAYRGWDQGVCFTEEQLWCRVHPGKHPACATADCRAEEVRLSLPGRNGYRNVNALVNDSKRSENMRQPVWSGCSAAQLQAIWNRFLANGVWQGACVPLGDKRSMLLRYCQAANASAAAVFYEPVSYLQTVESRNPPSRCFVDSLANNSNEWVCESL